MHYVYYDVETTGDCVSKLEQEGEKERQRERERESTLHSVIYICGMWQSVGLEHKLQTISLSLCLSLSRSVNQNQTAPTILCSKLLSPDTENRQYPWFTHPQTHSDAALQLLHLKLHVLIMIHLHKTTNSFTEVFINNSSGLLQLGS